MINCIYWEDKYKKLITSNYLKEYVKTNDLRLLAISDVTCDYMGSIDFLRVFTTIDDPYFVFHPKDNSITRDF